MSYYGERSARDPDWREAQLREPAVREARRRAADPEHVRAIRRAASARHRARQRQHGLTLAELQALVGPRTGSGVETLARVLAEEVAAGRVDFLSSTRCYRLNGGIDLETREALRQLGARDDDASREASRPRDPFRAGRRAAAPCASERPPSCAGPTSTSASEPSGSSPPASGAT